MTPLDRYLQANGPEDEATECPNRRCDGWIDQDGYCDSCGSYFGPHEPEPEDDDAGYDWTDHGSI